VFLFSFLGNRAMGSCQGGNHHLTNVDRGPIIADIVHWLEKQRPS
jgi:hypothetical protein